MRDDVKVVFSAADEFSATLNKFRSEMGSAASEAERHWTAVQGAWLKVSAAIATAAYAAKKAWDFAAIAAQFEEQKIALDGLARQYGTSSAVMINSIQRAAEGTIAAVDAIGVANKALIMGLNPEQLEFFTMAAKRLSGAIGGDTASAFERLTEAVATGQQRQLRQLGIIVDLEAEYKKYGHELSTAEKQTANFEIVSRALNTTLAQMGPDIDMAANKMERLTATMKDLKKGIGDIVLSAAGAVHNLFYPAGLASAFAQAEADSRNLYKNLDELKKKAKELAAEGLFISPTEQDVYRSRDWLTTNLVYMEYLEDKEKRFREQLLKTPLDIYWLPSDEEINRKTSAILNATKAATLAEEQLYMARQQQSPYEQYTQDIVAGSSPVARAIFEGEEKLRIMQEFQQRETELIVADMTAKLQLAQMRGASEIEIAMMTAQNTMQIEEMTAQHKEMMERMKMQVGIATLGQSLSATSSMMMQGSKKQFEIGKKLALAGAIVSGGQAVMNALATPPFPLGLALAALAAAQTAMQIQIIRNTQFMGGATAFSGAGGIGSAPSPMFSEGYTPTSLTEQEAAKPSQDISINVYALDPSSINWDRLAENNIIPALNNAGARNIKMNVNVIADQ